MESFVAQTPMEEQEDLRRLIEKAPVPMLCLDEPGRILLANEQALDLLGRHHWQAFQRPLVVMVAEPDRRRVVSHLGRVASGVAAELEISLNQLGDGEVPILLLSAPVTDAAGNLRFSSNVLIDISQRRQVENTLSQAKEHLTHIAHHDALTALPNRYLFEDRLEQAVLRCRRNGWLGALVFVDIDNFKYYNDTHGHSVGDGVLVEAAKRLSSNVREQDTVCRYSGDEFLLILENVTSVVDVEAIVGKLKQEFSRPVYGLTDGSLRLSASFGVTLFDKATRDVNALVRQADAAMYEAKESNQTGVTLYSHQADAIASNRRMIASDLEVALDRAQFELLFQPQTDVATGKLAGIESLLRWHHPTLGEVMPENFIEVAENAGYSERISEWVLHKACRVARSWLDQGCEFQRIAVNISGREIGGETLLTMVETALTVNQLPPESLEIEVTETRVMRHPLIAKRVLAELSGMGVKIALDDFGTGYSSLLCLRDYPFERIKIDKSFVSDLGRQADSEIIVGAMVSMANSLGIDVVAEGVETAPQKDRLTGLGVNLMQGYYFAEPLNAAAIANYLRRTLTASTG